MAPFISYLEEDICKLYCIAEDFDFFFAMSSKVKDGTSCSDYKGGVCIDGICEVCEEVMILRWSYFGHQLIDISILLYSSGPVG